MRFPLRAARPLLPALAALLCILAVAKPGAAARPFDVPGDHWAAPAITTLTAPEVGLIELFPDKTFRGYTDLQKYDLVKSLDSLVQYMAARGVRLGPEGALPALPYADVPADHFAVRSIRRLLWMIPGDKHLFRGRQTMTRLDMSVWLYLLLKDVPQARQLSLGPVPVDVDAAFAPPARWALAAGKEGLISRYPDGRFHPERTLTRYELAYTLYQVLRWLTDNVPEPENVVVATVPAPATDGAAPEIHVFEPEVEGARDFVVVSRKKQMTVAGVAADDTGIAQVTVNGAEAALAFADEADLKKSGLKGPAAVWFRVQVAAPEEGGPITIAVTDKAGKKTAKTFLLKGPKPDDPVVVQAATQPASTERVARKWALLIGVNRYDDTQNIPTLRYSVRDVTAVYEMLTDEKRGGFGKDTVFLLTDDTPDKPTNINIIKYLNRIAKRAEPDDMVLVYYSGHGYQDPDSGRGYILPCNTDIEALSASAVDNADFIDTLDRMKAQRIVTILDACHSGSIQRAGGSAPPLSGQFYGGYGGGKGRVFLASASANQKAWEDARLGHGVFTEYVKRGFSGEGDRNRDGAVTFIELAGYVTEKVSAWAKANGKEQDPMIQAENFVLTKKDIVLALNPSAIPKGPLADKKRLVYAKLDPDDADYACGLLEKSAAKAPLSDLESKILQYVEQMVADKIQVDRYLDFVRTMRPSS